MIIDTHTHLGRNQNMQARVGELLKSMDAAKIDQALVFAGSINGCPNDEMLREIGPHVDRLRGVIAVELGQMHGDMSLGREMYLQDHLRPLLQDPRVVAAKFYLGYEHYMPDSPRVYDAMREIQAAGKTAIFHTGDCFRAIRNAKLKYAHPLGIDDVATDFPDTRIVIAHMGNPWIRDAAEVVYKNPNVYVDLSGFVYGKFDDWSRGCFREMYHEFLRFNDNDSDRILFGTDWPISDQSSYVETVKEFLVIEEFADNAMRAFNLEG